MRTNTIEAGAADAAHSRAIAEDVTTWLEMTDIDSITQRLSADAHPDRTSAASSPPDGAPAPAATRIPLLFLFADTGGGHRSAAQAVSQALEQACPGRFAPLLCDPLGGPGSARLLRWLCGRYGSLIRRAPWAWGVLYRGSDSRRAMGFLRRTLFALADRPVAEAVTAQQPAAIVSFHPLTGSAAVHARQMATAAPPILTVVTDLITPHAAWRCEEIERIVAPSLALSERLRCDGLRAERCLAIGLPVGADFWRGPLPPSELAGLRRALGVNEQRFLIVLTGGGEGAGGIAPRADAILRQFDDVEVVAICGRNRALERRLNRLAAAAGGRLVVKGFIENMADWLRCADLVVSKAGPSTIAEATCCGAALLLTAQLPGQEAGNTEFVVGAGAGSYAPSVPQLLCEIDRLRQNPAALTAMRAASARLGRPNAAAEVAAVIAGLAEAACAHETRPQRREQALLAG